MNLKQFITCLILGAVTYPFAKGPVHGPNLKDADGNVYKSVKVGDQYWQAKNMNVKTDRSLCYDNKPENCDKYGRLYAWEDAKTVCPTGWHLPTAEEFDVLLSYAGTRGVNLRAKSWKGTDDYGLSLLPAGTHWNGHEVYGGLGNIAGWWSATKYEEYEEIEYDRYRVTFHYRFGMIDDAAGLVFDNSEIHWSVRCIKD